jgi:hypothetical protein
LFTRSGVALQPALISVADQRNSVMETLLWNFSKVNLSIGGWVNSRIIRRFSASAFNPTKILRIDRAVVGRLALGLIATGIVWANATLLWVDSRDDRVWDAAVPARAAPEFRGFRRPSAIGDCNAALPKETLQASGSRALKLVITRVYAYNRPQKSHSESLHMVRGILSLMYFQNGDERCCTGVTFSRQEWLRPWRSGFLAWPPRRPNFLPGRGNGAALR